MTIYLYVKTHRVTGLKYFGKTVQDNPYYYQGSGKYWRRHLKKHGYNVETEIVGTFENADEAQAFALVFSKENNIVESKEWANLILENVKDGNAEGTLHREETRKKIAKSLEGVPFTKERCENISKGRKGVSPIPRSEKHRKNISKVHEKQWIVIDPSGKEYIITNLKTFCLEHELYDSCMHHVATGFKNIKQHKGWTCKKLDA